LIPLPGERTLPRRPTTTIANPMVPGERRDSSSQRDAFVTAAKDSAHRHEASYKNHANQAPCGGIRPLAD